MSPHLSSLLVALQALSTATTSLSEKCNHGGEKEVTVEGWPVLVALRMPYQAKPNMTLHLSHNHEAHTNLTLVQSVLNEAGVLQVTLESIMIGSRLKMATQLLDSSWATFRIFAHANELNIKIVSENHSFKYSTSAFISTINHQEVNKVSCSGEGCQHYIDLKCPYSDSKSNHTEYNEPESISSTSENKTGYYWLFYVMVSLVVVACLLLFIWRNERQKFRIRWWRHSQNVRRMGRDSCQAECTNEVSTGIGTMSSLAFPNPAYDATGDCD